MIYVKKPKNYKYRPGQFCFINCPSVKRFQWHPYSFASAPKNKYLIFMVKRVGDWTGKFIDRLLEAKKRLLKVKDLNIEGVGENDVFTILKDLDE